jgi:hypothetical protein
MKKPVLLILYSLLSLMAVSQRVDLDKFSFNASYRELPHTALDTSYHTYSVAIDAGPLTRMAVKENDMQQELILSGWRKLSMNGHLQVNVKMEDVIVEKSDVKERVEILKDKSGKETGQRKHYWMELIYSYAARVNVTDYKGVLMSNTTLMTRDTKHTYSSSEYATKTEAQIFFAYNVVPVTSDLSRQVIFSLLRDLSNKMTYSYGFSQITYNDFMWILGNKKHPEYEAHRQAFLTIKQAFFEMNAEEPVDKIRQMVQPAIDYFEKIKKTYASSSKTDRKMRYASYFNLSKLYYYLDDAEGAMREASALVMNDFDARDGRVLEGWAKDLKWTLQQNKMASRHFPINIDQYEGPNVNAAASK